LTRNPPERHLTVLEQFHFLIADFRLSFLVDNRRENPGSSNRESLLNYGSKLQEKRFYVLPIVLAAAVAFMLSNLNFPPISKLISDQFSLSNAQTGLVTSFYFIPYAAMQIPGGYFADRFGSSRSLLASVFIMSLAPFIFIYGGSVTAIYVSRVVAGASGGVVFPSMVRLLSQTFPRNELGRAMGLFGSANGVGQLAASSLLPLLILGANWHPPLFFTISFSLVVSFLLLLPVKWAGSSSLSGVTRPKVIIKGLFTRNMFALMLPNFASVAVTFGTFAWAADFLTTKFSVSNSTAGGIVALLGVSTIIGSYAGGIADKIIGSRLTIAASMALLLVFTYMFGVSASALEAAVFIFGMGVGANLYFATDFSLIPFASSQGIVVAGTTFGVFNTLSNIGSVIAPVLFGVILDATGSFSVGFAALAVVALLGIAGAFLLSLKSLR
jgi:MFS family permease